MKLKEIVYALGVLLVATIGFAFAQPYPTPYVYLFPNASVIQQQTGNTWISGSQSYATQACTATSLLPCKAQVSWLCSGTSCTPATLLPAPANAQCVADSSVQDTTGVGQFQTQPTSSPYNGVVVTKTFTSAQPTATAGANLHCD